MFADDVAIICDSPEKLQMALNVCESYSWLALNALVYPLELMALW
jgi:hypothetical protein